MRILMNTLFNRLIIGYIISTVSMDYSLLDCKEIMIMNNWVKQAIKQQKKIKSCDNHEYKFFKKQTIKVLESQQTWDLYVCIKCGLGKFQ